MTKFVLAVVLIAAGCGSNPVPKPETQTSPPQEQSKPVLSQWTLDSYDSVKGYTFSKDGVSYLAKCRTIYPPNQPSIGVRDQNECAALLPYLHKPVEMGTSPDNRVLSVKTEHDGDISLEVVSAK